MTDPDRLAKLREWIDELYGKNVAGPNDLIDVKVETLDWLVGEVERLQRFEAMWEDCVKHRKRAEGRATRYRQIVAGVVDLLVSNNEAGYPP